jgi:hypothetical protein
MGQILHGSATTTHAVRAATGHLHADTKSDARPSTSRITAPDPSGAGESCNHSECKKLLGQALSLTTGNLAALSRTQPDTRLKCLWVR